MIGSCKCSLTMWTLEWFHSGVFSHVPCQLIRPCKFPGATFPAALVRFLSGVRSLVGLEVRTLCVDLVTAWVSAAMHTLVPLRLGIVVHSIHQFVGIVRSHARGH